MAHTPRSALAINLAGIGTFVGAELPRGCRWWQWVNEVPLVLGPVECRLAPGGQGGIAVETIAAPGFSEVHPYPGDDIHVQFSGASGQIVRLLVID